MAFRRSSRAFSDAAVRLNEVIFAPAEWVLIFKTPYLYVHAPLGADSLRPSKLHHKKILFAAPAVLAMATGFAFTTLRHFADIFSQLKIQPDEVKESVFSNFQDGILSFPYSKLVTQLATGKREAALR